MTVTELTIENWADCPLRNGFICQATGKDMCITTDHDAWPDKCPLVAKDGVLCVKAEKT